MERFALKTKVKLKTMSRGIQARARLALAFARRAELYLLDEPLAGVDINTRDKIARTVVEEFTAPDQTIIISSHDIADIEPLVDYAVIIDQGKIVLQGPADVLRSQRQATLADIIRQETA